MPLDIRIRFGRAIRRIREEQEINQEEAAERCGLHRTYYSGVERGVRNVSLVNLEKIAKGLKTNLPGLFEPRLRGNPHSAKRPLAVADPSTGFCNARSARLARCPGSTTPASTADRSEFSCLHYAPTKYTVAKFVCRAARSARRQSLRRSPCRTTSSTLLPRYLGVRYVTS